MKYLILCSALMLTGCATVRDFTNSGPSEKTLLQQARENQSNEAKMSRARDESLVPDASLSSIQEVWGSPKRTEYQEGTFIAYYDIEEIPIYMHFKDNKLISWKYDYAAAQRDEAERRNAARQRRGTHCVSRNYLGQVVTNCN